MFIKGFSHLTQPILNLTKKDVPFQWTEECREALDKLIKIVSSDPVLLHTDEDKPFELEVDASNYAIGAVLFQKDDQGRRQPIGYFSTALKAAEKNYDIWDKEFLVMIRALKHWRHLLMGARHKVIVYTDHANLLHYRQPQRINGRVARYITYLADFDLEL